MKNNEATIFVFIASIIIGLLISMNLGFEGEINFLDVKQYNEAYNERSKLYLELNNLQHEYFSINSRFKKYDTSYNADSKILEEIQKEVIYNNQILGKSDLEGPGVIVTLDDGIALTSSYDDNMLVTVHNIDIERVINDLRNAGAEATEVNGIRVTYNNSVICVGVPIIFSGIKIPAPFYISAIGNQDLMYNYLNKEQSHIMSLRLREIEVSIEKKEKIKILSYTGEFKHEYVVPLTKKD
ncbi:DUF881 domain-containing protein [Clostridium sp.]|uniref:DUF881 domain-containing protein n=1 Tax=Clostridium sp. TaxID=1506 RepID=UPI001A62A90A|nr:DUF881 domain-containing protein [Clostridium sp.]MBK5241276.1 DUF881 domain-containing protein [Clostridium sp.]